MHIREANQADIPEILKTLKASLGETSSEKTEAVWRYKHLDNPFGESLVLVAEEDNSIIGVRAFMRWRWQNGEEIYSAFRAVDTATHPDHQGKGVFKKLTLKALEIGKERGDDFVFNTPNSQSKPGYLKMGWQEVSQLRGSIIPISPLNWRKKEGEALDFENKAFVDCPNLEKWNTELALSKMNFTPKTKEFLSWRYLHNPIQSYLVESNSGFFIAGYVKQHKHFREFRISELIKSKNGTEKELKKIILGWAKKFGVQFVSIHYPFGTKIFPIEIKGHFGPTLTFKPIDKTVDENHNFLNLNSWAYSLGDFELF